MARLAAGVRKRADGSLEKRFTVDGKRYSIYGSSNDELTIKELEIRKAIQEGAYTKNKNLTLDKYFSEWLKAKENHVKENTQRLYQNFYDKQISPALGKRKIKDIEKREVEAFQRKLKNEGYSISTINLIMDVLKMILRGAVQDDVIIKSPADNVKALKKYDKPARETYHRALTIEEQQTFMDAIRGSFYYELVAFMLCTGVRVGEAGGLNWSDIDYKAGVIHIERTMTVDKDDHIVLGDSTKSRAGRRDIPLTNDIKTILKAQRRKWQNIIPAGNDPVFVTSFGNRINNHLVNFLIRETLNNLEQSGNHIEHFTAHALRDTFATRFIENGGSLQTLKTLLGHESYKMTADLYAHVLPNTKLLEMERMKNII